MLSRNVIFTLFQQLQGTISKSVLCEIEEISPLKWVFIFKNKSDEKYLLFSLKPSLTRFHLLTKSCEGIETLQTKAWLSYLKEATLDSIEMVNKDRIIQLKFKKVTSFFSLLFEVFPQRPNLYLLDEQQNIILSFYSSVSTAYIPPENIKIMELPQIDPAVTHERIEKWAEAQERELAFKLWMQRIQSKVQQKIRNSAKSIEKCSADLKKCQEWEHIYHEGVLLKSHFFLLRKGMKEIVVTDWEKEGKETRLILDPLLSPNDIVAKYFKTARKLKSGIPYQQNRLEELSKESTKWEEAAKELATIGDPSALEAFVKRWNLDEKPVTKEELKAVKALPYYEFVSATGIPIWVGKNAKSNEKLTFSHAKGSDWWLHVNNYPGSHVIIKVQKKQEPDEETLQEAFQLAIAYSKAKEKGEAEICLTQCKFVSRIGKNQPGKVQISKHKNIYVKFDPVRFQNTKSRSWRD